MRSLSRKTGTAVLGTAAWLAVWSGSAYATQVHAAPEGLYAHQMAHILFVISMGVLIYWLRSRRLTEQKGWRLLQYSALFFILWNLDAFATHHLEGMEELFSRIDGAMWDTRIAAQEGQETLTLLYWIGKLDHLLAVPAILFLYFALRRFLEDARQARKRTGEA